MSYTTPKEMADALAGVTIMNAMLEDAFEIIRNSPVVNIKLSREILAREFVDEIKTAVKVSNNFNPEKVISNLIAKYTS